MVPDQRAQEISMASFFFFFCRYCMLFAFVGLMISLHVTTPVRIFFITLRIDVFPVSPHESSFVVQALYTFNSWSRNMAILSASTSLMLRTIALWERQRTITITLGALCLVHWALLYHTIFAVIAVWDDTLQECVVTAAKLNTTFFFTMGFDLIILVLTAVALLRKYSARTNLWKLLFQDGLVFFLVSFSTNCIPAVLNVLNLNSVMNVVAILPPATITSIAACRAVIRLMEFSSGDVYVHSMPAITSIHPIRHSVAPYSLPKSPIYVVKRPEVHVTTEHIAMAEFSATSPYSKSHGHRTSPVDLQPARNTEGHSESDDKALLVFSQAA
ncbi:hypothetical protein Hypma_001766 [Hypsizygus marmoreus]|uniref:Satratoxin biosynthesis SC1 cluster protein 4 n=1 Tax=Hypsizygus marmoreus TaxID=39966 RepID=A0A369JBZ6_HYPMA|nr:hypothetical protein Hypma_001766 [Hypsizygus marmoreus]